MAIPAAARRHSYCLVVNDAGIGPRSIELEGGGPYAAMVFVQRELADRNIEVFEDGRSLGKMRCTPEGFWTVFPRSTERP